MQSMSRKIVKVMWRTDVVQMILVHRNANCFQQNAMDYSPVDTDQLCCYVQIHLSMPLNSDLVMTFYWFSY